MTTRCWMILTTGPSMRWVDCASSFWHLGSLTAANWVSFDFNVAYSSRWGYSLTNTLKLKKFQIDLCQVLLWLSINLFFILHQIAACYIVVLWALTLNNILVRNESVSQSSNSLKTLQHLLSISPFAPVLHRLSFYTHLTRGTHSVRCLASVHLLRPHPTPTLLATLCHGLASSLTFFATLLFSSMLSLVLFQPMNWDRSLLLLPCH